ncbi:MAG: hypothetical protein IK059_00870 [Firmicutes bacterium]|nr:hypothetical protein [Bacillota bacterium]
MLQNKTVKIILSILIAIFLWYYVYTEENPTITQKFENVPVQILNEESLESRGLITVGTEEQTVTLTVEGKRAELKNISASDFVVTADVYGYGVGENNIPIKVDAPAAALVTDIKPNRITIQIDELVSVAHDVEAVPTTALKDGRELYVNGIQPAEVMVTGARSIVTQISAVEARVDADKLSEKPKTVHGTLVAVDANGEEVTDISLSSETAEVDAQILRSKEVPLDVNVTGEVSSKYTVSEIKIPETIKIIGTKDAIEDIEKVKAADIDISDITATTKINLALNLPEGVYPSQGEQVNYVYVVINNVAVTEVEIPAANIELRGTPEGATAFIDETLESVKLTVRGTDALVQSASASDFVISADLTGLEPGTHEVALSKEYIKSFTSVEMEPVRVQVTIKNEAQ